MNLQKSSYQSDFLSENPLLLKDYHESVDKADRNKKRMAELKELLSENNEIINKLKDYIEKVDTL